MDVCLQEYGHCNFISEKHCSIFYDEVFFDTPCYCLFYV